MVNLHINCEVREFAEILTKKLAENSQNSRGLPGGIYFFNIFILPHCRVDGLLLTVFCRQIWIFCGIEIFGSDVTSNHNQAA